MGQFNKINVGFLAAIVFYILTFTSILVVYPKIYTNITYEDRLVEYLGFLFLLISGLILGFSAFKLIRRKRRVSGWFLLLAAITFLVAAFEEISWGQRLLGFETPEAMKLMNEQDEFNFHNIDKKFFDRAVDRLNILFVFFATIMILLKKDKLWNIKLPEATLTLSFALIPFYHQYNQLYLDFHQLLLIPILVIMVRGMIIHKIHDSISSLIVLAVIVIIVVFHTRYNHHFPYHNNSANEVRETLFALVCLYYSFCIFLDLKYNFNEKQTKG